MTKASLLKRIDDVLGPVLCRAFSRPQTEVDYPAPTALSGPILVIRPGGIGDAVVLLPMLAALRRAFPDRAVEVLCESRNHAVVELAHPETRPLLYDTHPWAVLRRLRSAGYAAVLDTEQFHHFSGVLAAWTRAPLRVGFKLNTKRNALYTHLVGYDLDGPEEVQFGRLLTALCGRVQTLPPKQGILSRTALAELPADLPPPAPYAVVHAGGSVPCKRWPAACYAELCDRLLAEHGLRPVLVGGPDDRAFAGAIRSLCRTAPPDACARLSLAQTTALCRAATLFVGPDSGIAHLATAAGTPCAVLFGPSDPAKWGPGAGGGAVVRHPVPCGPCAIFGYNKPCRTFACMTRISVADVLSAVATLVGTSGAPGCASTLLLRSQGSEARVQSSG
jgi:ADP-heptose:LPS heptosyltransferase